jgi:hypothetical protein
LASPPWHFKTWKILRRFQNESQTTNLLTYKEMRTAIMSNCLSSKLNVTVEKISVILSSKGKYYFLPEDQGQVQNRHTFGCA